MKKNILKKYPTFFVFSAIVILFTVIDIINSPKEYGKPWYGQLLAGPQMMAYLIQIDYWMRKYSVSI